MSSSLPAVLGSSTCKVWRQQWRRGRSCLPRTLVLVLLASAGAGSQLTLAVCPTPLPCYCIGNQVPSLSSSSSSSLWNKTSCRRATATIYASAPCKLTISSYLFARWHLFRHVGCLRQQQVDIWPFHLETGVRVTCDVGYLCANFSLP